METGITAGKAAKERSLPNTVVDATSNDVKTVNPNMRMFLSRRNNYRNPSYFIKLLVTGVNGTIGQKLYFTTLELKFRLI